MYAYHMTVINHFSPNTTFKFPQFSNPQRRYEYKYTIIITTTANLWTNALVNAIASVVVSLFWSIPKHLLSHGNTANTEIRCGPSEGAVQLDSVWYVYLLNSRMMVMIIFWLYYYGCIHVWPCTQHIAVNSNLALDKRTYTIVEGGFSIFIPDTPTPHSIFGPWSLLIVSEIARYSLIHVTHIPTSCRMDK